MHQIYNFERQTNIQQNHVFLLQYLVLVEPIYQIPSQRPARDVQLAPTRGLKGRQHVHHVQRVAQPWLKVLTTHHSAVGASLPIKVIAEDIPLYQLCIANETVGEIYIEHNLCHLEVTWHLIFAHYCCSDIFEGPSHRLLWLDMAKCRVFWNT